MKRIIIINHYGITPDMPGATKHFDLAMYFANKKEYQIEFWMCGFNHHTGRNEGSLRGIKFQFKKKYESLLAIKIKSTPYKHSSILRQLNHMIFDFITAIKIFFSRGIGCVILSVPPVSNFNVWATKVRKIKLITDVEDLWPLFLQDMGMNKKAVVSFLEKSANYMYNLSDSIDAVSDGMVEYVRRKVKDKSKEVWLAPLGVNLEQYNLLPDSSIFNKYEWKDKFKIMYIGAHGKANGIEDVLYTISELDLKKNHDIAFIFIGAGEHKNELVSLKKKLCLECVYFEDAIASSLVPRYLINADICLTNLCKVESFKLVRPNKLFQYMAAKAPIICGIWGESKKIIEDSNSGIYVDFTDYIGAAKKIKEFIYNKDLLRQCKIDGYKYICKYGDRNKIFEDFYRRTVELMNK